ncbi:MAG: DNA-binding domain-containing protein [Bacteroidota bacterium]|jgi:predicted histone-like DNA-binding protein|nr:DNA-binding domain-containing protein [Bacteroidota bacterium]
MQYRLVQKANPANRKQKAKWYANPVNKGKITSFQVSKDIAKRTAIKRGDVHSIIQCYSENVIDYLMAGYSVTLGNSGIFRLSLSSEGVEEKNDFSPDKIKSVRIIFTPSTQSTKKINQFRHNNLHQK